MNTSGVLKLNLTKHRRCWYTLTATLHPAHTHQRATSGVVYVLQTGSSYFPPLWSSKKQSSTARGTAEAELIACASTLFGEALNLHTMIESLIERAMAEIFTSATQPLSHSGRVADAATQPLSHSGRVAEWLLQRLWQSG